MEVEEKMLFVTSSQNRWFIDVESYLCHKMNLSEAKVGSKVKILSLTNGDLALKLMEMGCLPGEEVVVWKKAPLGDPIYILVAGYSLSLRLNEAAAIEVETLLQNSPVNK